jgi:hypothetical protein
MHQITVAASLGKKLTAFGGKVAMFSSDGRVLGVFLPLSESREMIDFQLESPLSIEETKELQNSRTGRPLEDILRKFNL